MIISPCDSNTLVINEFVAKGSLNSPPDGSVGEDWFEIYNYADSAVQIDSGSWFVSDDPSSPDQFALPAMTISSGDFIVVWCDDRDTVNGSIIHSNFKLSGSGDFIGIYQNHQGLFIPADEHTYGAQQSAISQARSTDGCGAFRSSTNPTPGGSNE